MTTRLDVEQLLENLPVSTPQEANQTRDVLQMFIGLRNTAFESAGVNLPPIGMAFNATQLAEQLRRGETSQAAATLIQIGGDAASTLSILAIAALRMGAISHGSRFLVAGTIGGLAAPFMAGAGISLQVLVGVAEIPSDVNQNQWKLFYIADVSGILTSWLFAARELSPHSTLVQRARTGGYSRSDVSAACRMAHRRARTMWMNQFHRNEAQVRRARASVNDSWEEYWRRLSAALESSLRPFPRGIAASFVNRLIHETRSRQRQANREAERLRRRAALRRAQGGVWVRGEEGIEWFLPD